MDSSGELTNSSGEPKSGFGELIDSSAELTNTSGELKSSFDVTLGAFILVLRAVGIEIEQVEELHLASGHDRSVTRGTDRPAAFPR